MLRSKDCNKGTLYLVATPIGNLCDISSRAKEVLNSVSFICAEDTRTSKPLLDFLNIHKPIIAYHKFNESEMKNKIIARLEENLSCALISDAGYPSISDPGQILVKAAIDNNIKVSIIPGGNALLSAVAGSGLNTDHFYFHGFLSSQPGKRKKELESLKSYPFTLIFYESPHRLTKTLSDMKEIFGNRQITLARELTKIYEEYIYGRIDELLNINEELKGEIVLVVEGNQEKESIDEKQLLEEAKILSKDYSKKDISKILAEKYNLKKNYIYQLLLEQSNF